MCRARASHAVLNATVEARESMGLPAAEEWCSWCEAFHYAGRHVCTCESDGFCLVHGLRAG